MKVSIGQAWDETRGVLARDGALIATVALALLVLPGALVGMVAPPGSELANSGGTGLPILLSTLIAFAGQIAIARIALGPPLTVGQAIGLGFRRFLMFFSAWVLWLLPFVLAIAAVLGATGIDLTALTPDNPNPPQLPLWANLAVLALTIALFVVAARMLLLTPAAAAERGGPIALLKRSWELSRGNAWKLFALLVLVGLVFVVLVLGLGSAIGSVVVLALGRPEAFSVSALLLSLLEGVLSAVVSVGSAVMLARIYAQAAGASVMASVPEAGGE